MPATVTKAGYSQAAGSKDSMDRWLDRVLEIGYDRKTLKKEHYATKERSQMCPEKDERRSEP